MRLMTFMSATPRTLADDLLILAAGRYHYERIVEATIKSYEYLKRKGAKAATSKSILFASTPENKAILKDHKWQYSGSTITVSKLF